MIAATSILEHCDSKSREEQRRILSALEPVLTLWTPRLDVTGHASFLAVATWAQRDSDALGDYFDWVSNHRGGARKHVLALHGWFSTAVSLRAASGYSGACLQTPILVFRDPSGSITWEGEGYSATAELQRRS